jgi:hypothetical protein
MTGRFADCGVPVSAAWDRRVIDLP